MTEALVGVIVGAILTLLSTIGYDAYKAWKRQRTLLAALRTECSALIGNIHSRQDILKKSVAALRSGLVLPGGHVRSPHMVYMTYMPELVPSIDEQHRNMLHIAYETMRVGDEWLENQEDSIVKMRQVEGSPKFSAHSALADQLEDVSESYEKARDLLQKFLDGEEIDVYRLRSEPIRRPQ
jgi:hypothetical protein